LRLTDTALGAASDKPSRRKLV
jgi:hypothetical protein